MADTLISGSAQYNNGTNLDTLTTPTPIAILIGDRLFAHVKHEGTAISSPSTALTVDTVGGNVFSFVRYTSHSGGEPHAALFQCTVTNNEPVASITAHFPVGGRPFEVLMLVGFRPGGGDTEVFDTSAAAQGTSNAPSTGAVSVSPGGNGAAAMFVAEFTGGAHTQGTGWTAGSNPGGPFSEYRVLTSETTITGDSAWASSDRWIATLIADKTSGGAVTNVPQAHPQRNRRHTGRYM